MTINVLIADDHTIVAEALSYVLEAQSDIRVVAHVTDGHGAIRKAEELGPHVVLMDVLMPAGLRRDAGLPDQPADPARTGRGAASAA
jgi:DNA-binding NarL/FixJ family response regulator